MVVMPIRFITVALACFFFLVSPLLSFAQSVVPTSTESTFDPNLILDDRDMFDVTAMNLTDLQNFLSSKGTLGAYRTKDIDGREKSAAEIIWRVATSYHMNPKYLLALMQKEQSLVEDPRPAEKQFDWATGFGVCDACSLADAAIQEFKGFASQIEWAAKQHREKYLLQMLIRGKTVSGYAPGKRVDIDGTPVTPANQATAMLYTYTPHLKGNLNLWHIWQRWFGLVFPDGTVVKGKTSGETYLIRFGQKDPFKSRAVAASMVDPKKIVFAEDSVLAAYPVGRTIPFSNYALVETPDRKRYLIVDDTKRLIADRKTFFRLGFNEDEVLDAVPADLEAYTDGAPLTSSSVYPTGLLAKDAQENFWYVEDGSRSLIPDKVFLSLYFKRRPAKLLKPQTLSRLEIGNPYRLHDGELVRAKDHPAVFVIEHAMRRPIPDAKTFEELGWKWDNVVVIPKKVMETYPVGVSVFARPSL